MRAVVLSVALAGCYQPAPPSDVPCASNGQCPGGLQCDVSRTPPVCVDRLPPIEPDASSTDTPTGLDAPDAPSPPTFVASANASGGAVASLSYALAIPPGAGRLLLVSVQLGSNCNAAVPDIL